MNPSAPELQYVCRDPCPRCGVRADIGCTHQRATAPEPFILDPAPPPREPRVQSKLTGRSLSADALLAELAKGPMWLRSVGAPKRVVERLIAEGRIERVAPRGGRGKNMIALKP